MPRKKMLPDSSSLIIKNNKMINNRGAIYCTQPNSFSVALAASESYLVHLSDDKFKLVKAPLV